MPRIKRLTVEDFLASKENYLHKNVDLIFKDGTVSHIKVLEIKDGKVKGENKLFRSHQQFSLDELWEVMVTYK